MGHPVGNQMIELLFVMVVILALSFDFINGFHDSSNAIATVVLTRALSPAQAVLLSAAFNFIGPFLFGTAVAATIGTGILAPAQVTLYIIMAALLGAIFWGLLTWYFGLPSSSSHAIVGGIFGAGVAAYGTGGIHYEGLTKIILALLISPLVGMVGGMIVMITVLWLARKHEPDQVNGLFRHLQLASSSLISLSHGTNDAQKTMGVITAALVAAGYAETFSVPLWVMIASAAAISIGTAFGGWRIIKTMGTKIVALRPVHGFSAEFSSAITILGASLMGAPVSTTHVVSSSLMGVGSAQGRQHVRWVVVRRILHTWVLTIPMTALIAAATYLALTFIAS